MEFVTTNPATGQEITRYVGLDDGQLAAAIENAANAGPDWQAETFEARSEILRTVAGLLRERVEKYAELITTEMGKPISQARAEVEKCAGVCEYYAERAQSFLADDEVAMEGRTAFVTYQPLGVVFAIMPWNFPFWQVLRFAAPTLMAGNTALLKHAPNVFGTAQAIEHLFTDAGLPKGVFTSLFIDHDQATQVIEHPSVQAVTLTGSTRAGRSVAATAGRALKKTVLELGGSDPYVILEDADLDAAVEACATGRLINTGQSCIAAKRLIVVDAVRDEFREKLCRRMEQATHGDPLKDPTLGPLARVDLRDALHAQVEKSVAEGASCLLGGAVPEGPGAFYPATILDNVLPGMPAYEDEMFGPVACILPARDEVDAIRIANDTVYGLGGAVFTRDVEHGRELATTGINAGACFVNGFVASDPRLPFGGTRASGYGRELSHHGIREFVNAKTVVVQ